MLYSNLSLLSKQIPHFLPFFINYVKMLNDIQQFLMEYAYMPLTNSLPFLFPIGYIDYFFFLWLTRIEKCSICTENWFRSVCTENGSWDWISLHLMDSFPILVLCGVKWKWYIGSQYFPLINWIRMTANLSYILTHCRKSSILNSICHRFLAMWPHLLMVSISVLRNRMNKRIFNLLIADI